MKTLTSVKKYAKFSNHIMNYLLQKTRNGDPIQEILLDLDWRSSRGQRFEWQVRPNCQIQVNNLKEVPFVTHFIEKKTFYSTQRSLSTDITTVFPRIVSALE